VWLASYLKMVGGDTGLTRQVEEFIQWELPLARGLQYQHAALVKQGVKTFKSQHKGDLMGLLREFLSGSAVPPNL